MTLLGPCPASRLCGSVTRAAEAACCTAVALRPGTGTVRAAALEYGSLHLSCMPCTIQRMHGGLIHAHANACSWARLHDVLPALRSALASIYVQVCRGSGESRRGSTSAPDAFSRGGLFAARLVATVPFSVLRLSAKAGQYCSVAAASACCAEPPASVTGLPALLAAPPALSSATGSVASAGAARLRPDDKAFAPALAAASGAAAASSPPLVSPLDCPAPPVRASATSAAAGGKLARCRGRTSLPEPQLLS